MWENMPRLKMMPLRILSSSALLIHCSSSGFKFMQRLITAVIGISLATSTKLVCSSTARIRFFLLFSFPIFFRTTIPEPLMMIATLGIILLLNPSNFDNWHPFGFGIIWFFLLQGLPTPYFPFLKGPSSMVSRTLNKALPFPWDSTNHRLQTILGK